METDPDHPSGDPAALLAVTAAAAAIYTATPRRAAATAYLRQRGIDADALDGWPLGYAPHGWTRLLDALHGTFPDDLLLESGLARRSSRGSLIDTFRDRVIFPIHRTDGQVAGFIGRDLSGASHAPKYLNTRQNAIFEKGALLYGLWEGQTLEPYQPVVVEGPLDVLAIAAHNQHNGERPLMPVAACGTAFTISHARQLAAVTRPGQSVVIAMDGDRAGRSAATTAGDLLRHTGLDARIAVLPNGSDPADLIAHTASLDPFRAEHALPLLTVQVEHAIAAQGDRIQWVEGRLAAGHVIAGYLATYPVGTAAPQIAWISDALDLDPATFTMNLADAYRTASRGGPVPRLDASMGRDVPRPISFELSR